MKRICKDVYNVGVKDRKIDLFEGMYNVPDGVSYNSYLIIDDKIAVTDSVAAHFGGEWLKNIADILGGRSPDYLIVLHMEPDHSANIRKFIETYPSASIVGNTKTFVMIKEYFGEDFKFDFTEVKDGEKLCLGKRSLTFVFAPMVHWPEVMTAYEERGKALFSADAFGRFGADDGGYWFDEARRYYFGIVGKYGVQVQSLLNKVSALEIESIYPLHGPELTENIGDYVSAYNRWSGYQPETNGVFIAYTSVYGNTETAARELEKLLHQQGVKDIAVCDLARSDFAQCVANAFRFSATVLATTTYNGDVFPAMREFLDRLKERGFKNRLIGLVENGSWSPVAARAILKRLEDCKNLEFCGTQVKIRAALNSESSDQLSALAAEIAGKLKNRAL